MRVFFGMILGAILTIGGAFIYDTWATGPATDTTTTGSGPSVTEQHRPMVNWNVVNENWHAVWQRTREAWSTLSHKVNSNS